MQIQNIPGEEEYSGLLTHRVLEKRGEIGKAKRGHVMENGLGAAGGGEPLLSGQGSNMISTASEHDKRQWVGKGQEKHATERTSENKTPADQAMTF